MEPKANGIGSPKESAKALLAPKQDWPWHDIYIGTAEQLITAGLVRRDMLPGEPGRGKVQCTYDASGKPVGTGAQGDTHRLKISRFGKAKFRVCMPVGPEEAARREKALVDKLAAGRAAESAEARLKAAGQGDAPFLDFEGDHYVRLVSDSPALFAVGDMVITHRGDEARITHAYRTYKVESMHGMLIDKDGSRYDYKSGYVAQGERGSFFYLPHQLWAPDETKPKYLRLVSSHEQGAAAGA